MLNEQLVLVWFFLVLVAACVSLSIRFARRHMLREVNRELRFGFWNMRQRLKAEYEDTMSKSNLRPPEDVGDGRCF